jgi:hypothetical protein
MVALKLFFVSTVNTAPKPIGSIQRLVLLAKGYPLFAAMKVTQ